MTPVTPGGNSQPDAIEFDPIPLKPRPPRPMPPVPTLPIAPAPAPDTVVEPATGLAAGLAAGALSVVFVLSPGRAVNLNDIKNGTKVYRINKIRADGSMKLTAVTNPTVTVTAGTEPNTYQVQVSTTNMALRGIEVFVVVALTALKKAGAASGQFA